MDIDDLQDLLANKELSLVRHINGGTNPMNYGTKKRPRTCVDALKFLQLFYEGVYLADLSSNNRKPVKNAISVCNCFYCAAKL